MRALFCDTHSLASTSHAPLAHTPPPPQMWDVEVVGGVSMRDALGAWSRRDAGAAGKWAVDVPWPGNPTCVGVNSRL